MDLDPETVTLKKLLPEVLEGLNPNLPPKS